MRAAAAIGDFTLFDTANSPASGAGVAASLIIHIPSGVAKG